ncbi:hypothetical protein BDV95DRAFT_493419 [Massariosphaeria phaeospora]|uniref:Tyr recombinase domain-containing protein n=1 Tax=Massariosphaeria phaeospora TaxID=100035 RepID=A0A7C8M981_9PLEO|nr:hypothetical protein BDV95DRAFT_493419 [Massariosphaeria phaeospora]
MNWIKAYLSWRSKTAQSKLGKHIAMTTLLKELEQLQRVVRLVTGHSYDPKVKIELKSHVQRLVKSGNVSTKAKEKSLALSRDSEEILNFLWRYDEYTFAHPRIMIQLTFWLLISSIWGLRPGEVVESSCHRLSNEGLKYKDITFSLARRNGTLQYQILIALWNRKFHRDHENAVQSITLSEETDPGKRFVCPVRWFLSLALADEVFVQCKDPADFEDRWIQDGCNSRQFRIREDKQELPILRKLDLYKISEDRIMSATSVGTYLRSLGQRCGYSQDVTCYAFRRGFANGVDGKYHNSHYLDIS